MQNFRALGAPPPDPQNSPPLRISGYAPASNPIFCSRCNTPKRVTRWRAHLFGNQGCRSLLSIGGENLQFYPNFALFSTLGGMKLDHDFVQVSKLSEDPKKKVLTKNRTLFSPNSSEDQKEKKVFTKKGTFFPPNSSGHLRSDAHQSQIIGEDADVHHTILKYWGDTAKLLGGYIPPGFRHPCWQ